MSTSKRIISLLLALVMVLGMLPWDILGVEAAGLVETVRLSVESAKVNGANLSAVSENSSNPTETTVPGDAAEVTRAQWLQMLVETFSMTVENEAYPDNYFFDLSAESEYYYDMLLAVEFGVVDIPAGGCLCPDEPATREFAAQTLNYCLGFQCDPETEYTYSEASEVNCPDDIQVAVNRSWFDLQEGCFKPNQYITLAEAENMLADATAVLEAGIVDENFESIYTFTADVVVVPEGTIVDRTDDVLNIYNCPVTLTNGCVFAVFFDGLPSVYLANTVKNSAEATIVSVTALDEAEYYQTLEAQGSVDAKFTQFVPEEGTEVIYIDEETGEEYADPQVAEMAMASRGVIELDRTIKVRKELTQYGISGHVTVEIKNPKILYNISLSQKTASIQLVGNMDANYGLESNLTEAANISELRLGFIGIEGIGGVTVAVSMELKANLEGNTSGSLSIGVEYSDSNLRITKSFQKTSFSLVAEYSGKLGVICKIGITNVPADVIEGYVYAEIGGAGKVTTRIYEDDETCTHTAFYIFAEYGLKASVKFGFFKKSFEYTQTIWDENNSPVRAVHHYENGKLVPGCTRGDTLEFNNGYYTPTESLYWTSNWSGGNSSSGYNAAGDSTAIYTYTLNADYDATITGFSGSATAINIPSTIDGYPVTEIGLGAFSNQKKILAVNIPDSVVKITGYAFDNCSALTSVKLSRNLEILGSLSFRNCDALTSIEIPKSLNNCPSALISGARYYGAFYDCDNLKAITFEEGTTRIAENLFANCVGLERIEIPDTVTLVASRAFYSCKNLTSVDIGGAVTTIGSYTFAECDKLNGINMPNVVTIGEYVFNNCTALSGVILSENLASIPVCAFRNCDSLSTISIPKSVAMIGNSAFYDCDALEKVYMSNSVTKLGTNVFYSNDSLKDVRLSLRLTAIPAGTFYECAELDEIVIPYYVTSVADNAFYSSPKLKRVITHSKLESIAISAFSYPNVTVFYGHAGSYAETWCGDNGYAFNENTVAATAVTLLDQNLSIPRGTTHMLDFDIEPIDFSEVITIKSSNTAVATVDESGKINAVAPGTATIKIIVGGASTSCKVTVTQAVTKITLNKTKLSLDIPQTYQLTATITPSDASNKALNWTSSNPAAATVDANGLVTAVGNGTAVIKAESTDGTGISASCTVTVIDPSKIPVSGIALDKTSLSLEAMEDYQLTATISPANAANKGLVWSSSNEAVATVDSNGKVTAVARGTATITAAAADGYGASASCIVTVTNNGYLVTDLAQFQSSHPYADRCTDFWLYRRSGAGSLSITFAAETEIEDGFDYLYIYDGEGNLIGKYTGTELANQTITIPGDTVKVQIESDDSGNAWGFQVVDVEYTDHNHSFTNYVSDGNATCTEDGTKTAKCDHCDLTDTIADVGSALGHNMGAWNTVCSATCTENGEEQRNCTRCDHSESRTIEAVGHRWDNGMVTREPTEETEGERLYTCTACGATRTESIPVIGHEHSYETIVTAPTCTEQGYTTYTCRCGESYTADYVDALGHAWGDWIVIQEPTTTENGVEEHICTRCGHAEQRSIAKLENPFNDVAPGSFFYEPVMWAIENGITNGTSATTFGPNDQCMRAHVVTFLWRAVGSPEPTRTDNPFVDVKSTDFYYKPVLWAVENGITSGMDATHFGPTAYCNRAQVVTFLYRTMGNPDVGATANPFTDVAAGSFYEKPVLWAVENGVTAGLSATSFGPNSICNRAQIVTFLYRAFVD